MWLIDHPDHANLNTYTAPTVLLAQATQATNTGITRTIGACLLMENPVGTGSAVNLGLPVLEVNRYFLLKEKREMPLTGKVALLEAPKHGTLKRFADEESSWEFRYIPEQDYFGHDQATFLVEMGRQKVKLVYFFNIPAEGVPGGTEGYDPYRDKKLCPKGAYWKISSSDSTPSDLAANPYGIDWNRFAAGYADLSNVSIQFGQLQNGAVGQTSGTTITLDDDGAGYGWFVDSTPADNSEWLPTSNANEWVAKAVQMVGRYYAQHYNHHYQRTGTLFEGRYKATLIDSEAYLLTCMRYIELNPIRASMVRHASDYP